MVFRFHVPCSIGVFGASLSGKTHLVKAMLAKKNELFERNIGQIMYIYAVWSPLFDEMKAQHGSDIQFHKELPNEEFIRKWRSQNSLPTFVVLDDNIEHIDVRTQKMATTLCHHLDMVFLVISQSLFLQNKHYRTLSLNLHYLLIPRLRRDMSQITYLARQVSPAHTHVFLDAYYHATEKPYTFFLVNVHPKSNPCLTLISDFMSEYPTVYLDKEKYPHQIYPINLER